MVRVYVLYSLTHNKFVIKYSTAKAYKHEVGYINQYNQVLLQIIDLSKPHKKGLKYTLDKVKYISRINRLYKEEIKDIKAERRQKRHEFFINRRRSTRHY